jgi:hypothetical protein
MKNGNSLDAIPNQISSINLRAYSVRCENINSFLGDDKMNRERKILLNVVILVIAFGMAGVACAAPMGTAFTYQGRLADTNSPAEGSYDFEFELYDQDTGGNQFGNTVTKDEVDVIDGYFMVLLDFVNDANVFDGDARWLEIAIRPGASSDANDFATLSPRQELTPTPYAIYAENAGGDGDWTISGDDMYSAVSGNVGIGTNNPQNELDVEGAVAIGASYSGTDTAPSNGLIVQGNVGIGTTSTGDNTLYVYRPWGVVGPGYSTIYGYRLGRGGSEQGGTSWTEYGVDAAVKGYSDHGNQYTAGVAGYSYLDYANSAAVVGARWDGQYRGMLCYKESDSKYWAGYFDGPVKANSFNGVPWRSPCWFVTNVSDSADIGKLKVESGWGMREFHLPFNVTIEGFIVSAEDEANGSTIRLRLYVNGSASSIGNSTALSDWNSVKMPFPSPIDVPANSDIEIKGYDGNNAVDIACWLYGRYNE